MRNMLLLLLCILVCSGCRISNQKPAVRGETSYEGYYRSIEGNEKFSDYSLYYDISAEMTTLADGSHRYYIFLDSPQIAMYDVTMLAVENEIPYESAGKMMPNIGVFETTDYSLIPFQSNAKAGYMKGLVISGECAEDTVNLRMLVEWSDKTMEKTRREYIAFSLDKNGFRSVVPAMKKPEEVVKENE